MTLARVRLSQSKSRTKNNKENKDGELCMEKIQRDLSKKKKYVITISPPTFVFMQVLKKLNLNSQTSLCSAKMIPKMQRS